MLEWSLSHFVRNQFLKSYQISCAEVAYFLADGKLISQVKMEFDVVKPLKLKLYKRDDIYSKLVKNQPDQLFEKLNNYHPNMKLTIEVNPSKLLDTKK